MNNLIFEFKSFCICFLLVVGTSLASTNCDFVSFLAGVLLLEEDKNLPAEQKAEEYRQLQHITGISTVDAVRYIERYRNRPDEFKKVYTEILSQLTGALRGGSGKK